MYGFVLKPLFLYKYCIRQNMCFLDAHSFLRNIFANRVNTSWEWLKDVRRPFGEVGPQKEIY